MTNDIPSSTTENLKLPRVVSGAKFAYLASPAQTKNHSSISSPHVKLSNYENNSNDNAPINLASSNYTIRPLARERPFNREDYNSSNGSSNSKPPSIRSATSFGRPVNRFVSGQQSRHQPAYSNFSTMSENDLPWTTQDIGFNAISGVLNDPAKPKDNNKPSKSDIPPVPQAFISRIKPNDFTAYIKHISPVFERYEQNKSTQKEEEASFSPKTVIVEDESRLPPLNHHGKRTARNPYTLPQNILSIESLLEEDTSNSPSRDLPMLENVPSIFFEPDFHLENPQIFDLVCEGADIIGHTGVTFPVSTNSILQDKLSYYLDTVEVHLLREIENRSSSFFEALSNLQALHQQTIDCVTQIHTIRQKMKKVQDTDCKDGLEIIRLQVRKRNLEKLYKTTKIVRDIQSAHPRIQKMVSEGDYFGALDLITETRDILSGKSKDDDGEYIDVSSVKALSNFANELDEMQKSVGVMMQYDFISTLMSDLTYKLDNINQEEAKKTLLDSVEKELMIKDIEITPRNNEWIKIDLEKEAMLEKNITPCIIGLLRSDLLQNSLQNYRERLMVEIKDIIRKFYPSTPRSNTSPSSADDQSGYLAKQLKSMPFSSFFEMLISILSTLIEAIRRASVYHHLIIRVIESQNTMHSKALSGLVKESADIVFSAADLAHVRCGKLIGFRSDQNALLNPTDFYRLSHVIRIFILQCEGFCGRTCFGLRGTVTSQQKAFIEHFHMERIKQQTQLVENEQWAACEVPSEFQSIVDRICDECISSLIENTIKNKHLEYSGNSAKNLIINSRSYFIVGCSLLILKTFEDYLKCVWNLENMSAEITQKLVELLKLFNSRVCQVILGAGAMRSAGLKNITAKHLALASQSLAIMIKLIPKLKECIKRHLDAKQYSLLQDFDKISNDYKEHQSEIHIKLVSIMDERFTAHVKSMKAIQWDESDLPTGKNANVYMETLVAETVRLHKVLSKYLPSDDLKFIISQVFESFTSQLIDQIKSTNIRTEKGKQRLANDASYFIRRLNMLQDVDPPSSSVIEAIENIDVSMSITSITESTAVRAS